MQTEHITSHNCKPPADPCLREDSGACNHAVVAQSTCGSDTYLSNYNYHKSNYCSYYNNSNYNTYNYNSYTYHNYSYNTYNYNFNHYNHHIYHDYNTMSATTTATPPTTIATTTTRKDNNNYTKDWNLHNFKYTRHKY